MERFIHLNNGNKIDSIRFGKEAVQGELLSEIGELGQIMNPDGTFFDDPQDEIDRQDALKEQRKQELIQLMITANALRDDTAWATYKAEYDSLSA